MKIFILSVLILLTGCGNENFKKVEELNGFRILGIIASTPEVNSSGGSVNLDLVVSDSQGGGRTLTGEYQSCIDPGISLGAPASCNFDLSSTTTPFSINTVPLAGTLYTGIVSGPTVTVPANVLSGKDSRDQFNGVGYIVIFRFDVDGQRVELFKRIVVTNRGALNNNPVTNAASMTLNGGAVASRPQKDDQLKITNPTAEIYDFITVDGKTETRTESYDVAWYVTSGKIDRPKANIDDVVKYVEDPPTSSLLILALIRDERGGISVSQNYIP